MSDPEPKRKIEPATTVYVVKREDGLRKIGATMNLDRRVRSLQQLYKMRVEVEILWDLPNARAVEALTHALLVRFRSKRVLGREVYRASLTRISNAVATAIKRADIGHYGGLLSYSQLFAREWGKPQLYMLANQKLIRERWAIK